MSPDYAKQREALADLSVAYMSAQDFTRQVLCTAFGNVALGNVPPPSECVWPPDITQAEADSRLRAVQRFLAQSEALFKNVLREIEAAQVRLAASGFDVPRSWFIIDPLDTIKGWYLGACGVEEIVRSAASEDSVLETVVKEISQDLRRLKGEIAKPDQPTTTTKKNRRRSKPDPKVVERRAERAKQAKIDKEILADWREDTWGEYQNYVDWKNENLPDGWPKLDRSYVTLAIGREKARLKRAGKSPPR